MLSEKIMIGFVSERFSDIVEDCWKDLKRGCSDEKKRLTLIEVKSASRHRRRD